MTILQWAYQMESTVRKDEVRAERGHFDFFRDLVILLILLMVITSSYLPPTLCQALSIGNSHFISPKIPMRV